MDDYQKAQKEFYSLYTPLRKKYNLRLHIHFGLYEDGLIEIWEYEGEREKRLICKAAEENDTDCYKRAAEDLRFYKTLMEEKSNVHSTNGNPQIL